MILKTPRLQLVLEDAQAVLARIEALPAEDRAQVSPEWLDRLLATPPSPWTHGFSIFNDPAEAAVGSCGYVGAPDEQGRVEIAYSILPEHRGQGYAKEAALALVQFAYGSGAAFVYAHTLPEASPSTSVLKACGFQFAGDVVHPEDGPVWRWNHAPS